LALFSGVAFFPIVWNYGLSLSLSHTHTHIHTCGNMSWDADINDLLLELQVPHELSLHLDHFVRVKTGLQVLVMIFQSYLHRKVRLFHSRYTVKIVLSSSKLQTSALLNGQHKACM
jgi:hypothetical protein